MCANGTDEENSSPSTEDVSDPAEHLPGKLLGTFKLDTLSLRLATPEFEVRPIDTFYVSKIRQTVKATMSKFHVSFPPAVGNVRVPMEGLEVADIIRKIKEKELSVEIIDGNHTTQAILDLRKEFPDDERFHSRYACPVQFTNLKNNFIPGRGPSFPPNETNFFLAA